MIIGVDEVGRGSLAGPVCVAAVAVPKNLEFRIKNLGKLRDSKKLTPKKREAWFEYFKQHPCANYAVARVYPRQIEKRNISGAANLAALRAYTRLMANGKWRIANCKVFLDGGLYLGSRTRNAERGTITNAKTVVRGDEKIKAVAIASIIAKVTRDRQMVRLAKKYPGYGLEVHKGYGTKKHLAAIKRYGVSEVHRSTFC